jgi:hypothetical protein
MHNTPDWRDTADNVLAHYRALLAARGAIQRNAHAERHALHETVEQRRRHALDVDRHYAQVPSAFRDPANAAYANLEIARERARVELTEANRALQNFDAATAASMPPLDEALAGRLENAARRLELTRPVLSGIQVR